MKIKSVEWVSGKKHYAPGYGNICDLARRLGVHRSVTGKLHKTGVIDSVSVIQKNGRYIIHIEEAVKLLQASSDPVARGIKNKIINTISMAAGLKDFGGRKKAAEAAAATAPAEPVSFNSARTQKEHYIAEIKKLEFQERSGMLLREEDVRKGAFDMYRRTRDGLINIVDRISAQLATETDEALVRILLENEIRHALAHIREGRDE